MFWIFLALLGGYILVKFFSSLNKDNDDLQGQTLEKKFSVIVSMINEAAYDGGGSVTIIDKREFNLYQEFSNQIIKFMYSTGHLTIEWRFKYYQKETIFKKQYPDVRNLSIFEQEKIGQHFIKEAFFSFEKHKLDVAKDLL